MEDCIFCKIVSGKIPSTKIYEDDMTMAFLDISPISKGHTLVVTKEHAEKIFELSEKSSIALINAISKISKSIKDAFGTDFHILINNGRAAGQVVNHVHAHIIPRKENDGIHWNWPVKKYVAGEEKEIAEKIEDYAQK